MSDHDNGDGNITTNQHEEPTMTDTTTATTVNNNQDAVYAGGTLPGWRGVACLRHEVAKIRKRVNEKLG